MCRRNATGGYWAAFGAGLIVSAVLPSGFLLFLLAGALILLGIACCKR